jgi:hypothetical protein
MEARLRGLDPIAVTSYESTVKKAVKEASNKMKTSLTSTMGKLRSY